MTVSPISSQLPLVPLLAEDVEYLTKHCIANLFGDLLKRLMIDKPENPVVFLREHLIKTQQQGVVGMHS